MKKSIECPNCKQKFDINASTKDLNKFGYVIGSKGDFITNLIESKKKVSRRELILSLYEKYPNDNNDARLNRVLYELKVSKLLVERQGSIELLTKEVKK